MVEIEPPQPTLLALGLCIPVATDIVVAGSRQIGHSDFSFQGSGEISLWPSKGWIAGNLMSASG